MKTNQSSNLIVAALFAAVWFLSQLAAQAEIVGPYISDANTLHLYHMNASSGTVVDDVDAGVVSMTKTGFGLTFLATAYNSDFGTAISTLDGGQNGTAGTDKDAFMMAGNTPVTPTLADPTTGAFTMEALIRIQFTPTLDMNTAANGGNGRNSTCEIVCGDSIPDATSRVFQFRISPKGLNGGTAVTLDFINTHLNSSIQTMSIAVPTTGLDAIANGSWYHVAVAYNGVPNTANNLKFYWTLMDPSRTSAAQIGSANMTYDLPAGVPTFLSIGNICGRTATNANFLGSIDEVRISKTARAAGGMMFAPAPPPPPTITSQPAGQTVGLGQSVSFSVMAGATNWVTTSSANRSQGPVNFKYAYNFLQSEVLGSLLNNYTGYRGMQVKAGAHPITVTGLARHFHTGNTQTHTLKLVLASTGADVPGSSVTWSPAGLTKSGVYYVALAKPVTLAANTAYYVVSSETSGGDTWCEGASTTIVPTSVATVPSTVYGNGSWTTGTLANHCNGTVSFMYTSPQP